MKTIKISGHFDLLEEATGIDVHHQLAIVQSAIHASNLAVARWSSGNTYEETQLAQALRPTRQARWHAETNANFRRWLEAGGFSECAREAGEAADKDQNTTPSRDTPAWCA